MDSPADGLPTESPSPCESEDDSPSNRGDVNTQSDPSSTSSTVSQFAHLYRPKTADGDYEDDHDHRHGSDHHHRKRHRGGRRFVSTSRPATSMRRSALSRFRGQEDNRDATEKDASESSVPSSPMGKGLLTVHSSVSLGPGSQPLHCQFNPSASLLACACADGAVRLVKPKSQGSDSSRVVFALCDDDVRHPRPLPVTCLRWRPETSCGPWNTEIDKPEHHNLLVAAYAKGLIKYWHTSSNQCLATLDTNGECLTHVDFNAALPLFATCSDRHLTIYDENAFQVSRRLQSSTDPRIKLKLFQVKFHPTNPHLLFTGGWDDAVDMWDIRIKAATSVNSTLLGSRPAGVLSGPHVCGESIDIDPFHNHLFAASWRRESNLQIFDLDTMRLIKEIDQFDDYEKGNIPMVQPYCGRYLGVNHILVAGSHHNSVKLIDKRDFSIAGSSAGLPGAAYCLDFERHFLSKNDDAASSADVADVTIGVGTGDDVFFLKMIGGRR